MANSKQYKVRLAQGFNAAGRSRAGIHIEKGVEQTLELTKEQLAALEADVWITVKEAGEASEEDNTPKSEYDGLKQKDLKALAEERSVDITGIRSNDGIIEALEAAKAAPEAPETPPQDPEAGDDEDEDQDPEGPVEVDESMKREDLDKIATDLGIEDVDKIPNIPSLVKAIQDAQSEQSEA